MNLVEEAAQLRRALATADRAGHGRPYPTALRRRAVAYLTARRAMYASDHRTATELGVALPTLLRWARASSAVVFRAVSVEEQLSPSIPPSAPRVVVHGPAGLRIEGMDLDALVALWRRLS